VNKGAKIAIAVLSVAVVALVIVVVVLVESSGPDEHPRSKKVAITRLDNLDATVVLAAPDADIARVEQTLDASPVVARYADLPAPTLVNLLKTRPSVSAQALSKRVCAHPSTPGYAVELTSATGKLDALENALGATAALQSMDPRPPDAEVFMRVKATKAQTDTVWAHLRNDPDVTTVSYLDHHLAYNKFKRLFSDQPQLIQKEPRDGSGLPESFRIGVRKGVSTDIVTQRYQALPGVDQVNTRSDSLLWKHPSPASRLDHIEVFMEVKATSAAIHAVRARLDRDHRVGTYDFVSHEAAYERFKLDFADQPQLVKGETPAGLPTSFDVFLRSGENATKWAADYRGFFGVDQVLTPTDPLRTACSSTGLLLGS